MKTFKQFAEQIAPIKTIDPIEGVQSIDLRSAKRKMGGIKAQVKFYDSDWGRMQGGPPKGP